ncbi:tyrosine-type recombinase/integrase [Pseudomonas sp. OIL-1]|uniref:tyrosine-type recombinase/integrase n=1 Tax=Pseudomonas sp. OIL-1 TaxID=2706126 RepID=UPI0013A71D86|nr:tyrosine-type recombinase/integrase [Pseudomonas sp. OIL-1]QIB52413.1 tyrosine-type recombinase/integrase [Pseudomonas sp. OIL-1]
MNEDEYAERADDVQGVPRELGTQEAASAAFHEIYDFSHGEVHDGSGSLLEKIKADPTLSFLTSTVSSYRDDHWRYVTRSGEQIVVRFSSTLPGARKLYKELIYHLVPEFHPFGRVRSYRSTATYAHACEYLDWYIFSENGLEANADSIQVITVSMINKALDRARDKGVYRHYSFLYFIITFWISLSAQRMLSKELRLDIPLSKIDTRSRKRSVQQKIAAETKGWHPFSEGELSNLIEYALFWTEEALPELLTIQAYINETLSNHKAGFLVRSQPDIKMESVLGKKVNGKLVCGYESKIRKNKKVTTSGRVLYYDYVEYRWKNSYRKAIDNVMQGVLVLCSVVTGLRSSELSELKFSDVQLSEEGGYSLKVVRFKTSSDPNYFGDADVIPLPDFLGETLCGLEKLRNVKARMRGGRIFESAMGKRTATIMARSIQKSMLRIGDAVGVDGVHPHRFRKTIAEMLISRSERNIDLIRMLFGHRSYTMTLRYIARNPYIIASIAETIENHYAESFIEIVSAVQGGSYSGNAADAIKKSFGKRPALFKGKLLRLTISNYITYLLQAGEPVFIKRASVGVFCVSNEFYSKGNLPPCRIGRENFAAVLRPDPSNCKLDCKHVVVLAEARSEMQKNVIFYQKLLASDSAKLTTKARREIMHQIEVNELHLSNLQRTNRPGALRSARREPTRER